MEDIIITDNADWQRPDTNISQPTKLLKGKICPSNNDPEYYTLHLHSLNFFV